MRAATMRSRLANLHAYHQRKADDPCERARDLFQWDPLNEEGIEEARREAEDASWDAEDAPNSEPIFPPPEGIDHHECHRRDKEAELKDCASGQHKQRGITVASSTIWTFDDDTIGRAPARERAARSDSQSRRQSACFAGQSTIYRYGTGIYVPNRERVESCLGRFRKMRRPAFRNHRHSCVAPS